MVFAKHDAGLVRLHDLHGGDQQRCRLLCNPILDRVVRGTFLPRPDAK